MDRSQVMERSQTDPRLNEVRAVLQRLQTFSAQPEKVEPQGETSWSYGSLVAGRAPAAIALTIARTFAPGRPPATIALTTVGAAAFLGLAWLTYSLAGRTPSPAAATPNASLNSPAIPPVEASVSP